MLCLAGPVAAQRAKAPPPPKPALGLDVDVGLGFVTANIDRGVYLSNLPQLTPHLRVVVKPPGSQSRVILGLSGYAELSTPRDSSRFGLAADSLKRPNLAEVRPSLTFVQGIGRKGAAAIDVGFTYRVFPNVGGVTKANNMGIFRVGLGVPTAPIPLRVGFMYEAGALEGSSLEAGLGGDFRVAPGTALVLRADAGYQVKLEANTGSAPRIAQTVRRRGISHVDLTGGLDLVVAGAGVRPLVTLTYAQDTLGSITTAPIAYRWVGKFGVSLGIRKSVPKPLPPPVIKAVPAKPAPAAAKPATKPAPTKP